MDKALWESASGYPARPARQPADGRKAPERKLDWRRRMSDNVAYALLTYTALQIFVTMSALKGGQGSVLPYFALIILIAAIIPGCRLFEKRWEGLSDRAAADPDLGGRFRRDQIVLWLFAIGLPFALTGAYKGVTALL